MMFTNLERRLGIEEGTIVKIMIVKDDLRYRKHEIKKHGWYTPKGKRELKRRTVFVPSEDLRFVQCRIADVIGHHFVAHHIAHAYAYGRSTITNAERHLEADRKRSWVISARCDSVGVAKRRRSDTCGPTPPGGSMPEPNCFCQVI